MVTLYSGLVAAIVAVHLMFVAYLVVGGFLAWRWPRTIWLHVAAACWGFAVEVADVTCPLTVAERHFRERAGMAALPSDGFIDHYITGVLYPRGWATAVEVTVAMVVLVSWVGLAVRHRTRVRR